jgi:hypothetical protein
MTTLNLTEYGTRSKLSIIVRAHKPQAVTSNGADRTADEEKADLFNLAREIYLRSQRRKLYRRAAGII